MKLLFFWWHISISAKVPLHVLYLFCASRLQARWLPCSRADVVLSSCCLSLAISRSRCRISRRWLSSSAWHASFSCSSRMTSSSASSRPRVRDSTSTPDSRSSACSSSSCRLADSKVRPSLSRSALRFWLVSSNWSPYEKIVCLVQSTNRKTLTFLQIWRNSWPKNKNKLQNGVSKSNRHIRSI